MKKESRNVRLELDSDLAHRLDEILRAGMAEAGLIDADDTRSLRDSRSVRPAEASLDLDPKTAAALSQMLREGLVNASAAHQANNASVASAVGRVLEKSKGPDR